MYRFSYLLIFWYWIVAPLGIGNLLLHYEHNKEIVLHKYLIGLASSFSLYYVISMLFMRTNRSISESSLTFNLIMLIICSISFIKYRKLANEFCEIFHKNHSILFVIFIVLVSVQIIYVIVTTSGIYGDDIYYIGSINDMVYDNEFYSASYGYGTVQHWSDADYKCRYTSWMPYLASICMTTKLHPLIVVKTLMPILIVVAYYMVWWLFSGWLFDNDNRKQCVFGIFMAFITWFSAYSLYTVSKRVILYPRNGKAFLIAIFLPFLFYLINLNRESKWTRTQIIEIIITIVAAISSSLMSLIMIPAMIGCISIIKLFRVKKLWTIWQCVGVCVPVLLCGIILFAEIIGIIKL